MNISEMQIAKLVDTALVPSTTKKSEFTTRSVFEAVRQASALSYEAGIDDVIKQVDEYNERLAAMLRLQFNR